MSIPRYVKVVEELPEKHPAYGKIALHITNSNGHPLTGSDVLHNRFISLAISTAYLKRQYHNDVYFADDQLIEVEMSFSQWAELLSSFSTDGIPCTISRLNKKVIEDVPFVDKTRQFSTEFEGKFKDKVKNILEGLTTLEEGLNKESKMGKKEMRDKLFSLKAAVGNLLADSKFAVDQFNNNIEGRIKEAKIQVVNYMRQNQILGIKAISALELDNNSTIEQIGEIND